MSDLAMLCRSCGGRYVEMIVDLGAQPHCNRLVRPGEPDPPHHPLRLGFCHDCTLVQIDHTIPKEAMFTDYPYVSGTTATLVEHFRQTTQALALRYDIGWDDLVVDIGSNDGTWLKQWHGVGCRMLGVEPSEDVAALGRAAGVPALVDFFHEKTAQDIRDQHGPAKLITAAGVFFHLEDLHGVVRGCRLLLAEDGVLVIQALYLADIINNTAFDQIYHEHLCYYTLRSLSALLEGRGLEVFDVKHLPIHGGTMEYHVAHKGRREATSSVCGLAAYERAAGLCRFRKYLDFATRVEVVRTNLLSMLTARRDAGKAIWAYGAPAKGATLLNTFRIGPDLVSCAVEKNARKVGMEIPGCRIPIVAESDARPDAYLMLAWNFLDEFVAKERAWLWGGGEFIVPVPAVRVIGGSDIV